MTPLEKLIQEMQFLSKGKKVRGADFVLKKYEEQTLQQGIETMLSESDSVSFLHEEEDLYGENDLKKK